MTALQKDKSNPDMFTFFLVSLVNTFFFCCQLYFLRNNHFLHVFSVFLSLDYLINSLNKKSHSVSLSGTNEIRTHNHLVCQQTLNHLAKLANDWAVLWVLTCTVHLTVCYCHVTYEYQSESTLYSSPECQGTPFSKQVPYLKFKWQQWDSNLQQRQFC